MSALARPLAARLTDDGVAPPVIQPLTGTVQTAMRPDGRPSLSWLTSGQFAVTRAGLLLGLLEVGAGANGEQGYGNNRGGYGGTGGMVFGLSHLWLPEGIYTVTVGATNDADTILSGPLGALTSRGGSRPNAGGVPNAGAGSPGVPSSITGQRVFYAPSGGAGAYSTSTATATGGPAGGPGAGAGGAASMQYGGYKWANAGEPGLPNTGGGGGGGGATGYADGSSAAGGPSAGGSGLLVLAL